MKTKERIQRQPGLLTELAPLLVIISNQLFNNAWRVTTPNKTIDLKNLPHHQCGYRFYNLAPLFLCTHGRAIRIAINPRSIGIS
ncbi:hypothetical protein PGT21_027477 [Puccinia graminis f. sp. tritici]|uniref:Uncharacterized protein n=1 Tax=Puccinia graminis f. sp. tritici TaxID=56615 RepID=A0A5B0MFW7_PUCGR|nr:hypothetical protein PGT21_027477 [Puccinia graminis f. sp. tritici]